MEGGTWSPSLNRGADVIDFRIGSGYDELRGRGIRESCPKKAPKNPKKKRIFNIMQLYVLYSILCCICYYDNHVSPFQSKEGISRTLHTRAPKQSYVDLTWSCSWQLDAVTYDALGDYIFFPVGVLCLLNHSMNQSSKKV